MAMSAEKEALEEQLMTKRISFKRQINQRKKLLLVM